MKRIERQSSIPIWKQIYADLRQQFDTSRLPVNTQLPSENDLADRYDVSRVTIRNAITQLEKEGYLQRVKGSGTFVTRPNKLIKHELALTVPWAAQLRQKGHIVNAQVTRNEFVDHVPSSVTALAQDLLSQFQLGSGFALIERVQMVDNDAIGISQSWIPNHLVPNIDQINPLVDDSLSLGLRHHFDLVSAKTHNLITIQITTVYEEEILKSGTDEPLLTVIALTYDQKNELIQVSRTGWLSKRVRFSQTRDKDLSGSTVL
ncbi:MAG: GntR family transcriptional regulator [Corynebacterium glutamicum]|nr:GntR family transcriptional regulator [Corynebacterium glutamicum]